MGAGATVSLPAPPLDIESWDAAHVRSYLEEMGLGDLARVAEDAGVDGKRVARILADSPGGLARELAALGHPSGSDSHAALHSRLARELELLEARTAPVPPERGPRDLNVVVCGPAQGGKSSLVGQMLVQSGVWPPEHVAQMGAAYGREDDGFAFCSDRLRAERETGASIDTTSVHIGRSAGYGRSFTLTDVPGDPKRLRNAVSGISQGDCAVYVVPVVDAEETADDHLELAHVTGIRDVVVAVSKMDLADWSQGAFEAACDAVRERLHPTTRAVFVPVARGEGVDDAPSGVDWYCGKSVMEALCAVAAPARHCDRPLRVPVAHVYEIDGRVVAVGRVAAGVLRERDPLIVAPLQLSSSARSLRSFGGPYRGQAFAGDVVSVGLSGVRARGPQRVRRGHVLSPAAPDESARAVLSFEANVRLFARRPGGPRHIKVGFTPVVLAHTARAPCRVVSLSSSEDGVAASADGGEEFVATFEPRAPLCVEPFHECPLMGAFAMRAGPSIVGVGVVRAVVVGPPGLGDGGRRGRRSS